MSVRTSAYGPTFDWTDERVVVLKRMWADGLSGSVIAKYFGVSRQAAIAKVHRLGVQRRDKTVAQARASRCPDRDRNVNDWLFPRTQNRQFTPPAPTPPVRHAPAPIIMLAPVVPDTRPRHPCRWPVNAEGEAWSFCEAPRDPRSKSYCHDHHARSLDAPARQRFLAKRA